VPELVVFIVIAWLPLASFKLLLLLPFNGIHLKGTDAAPSSWLLAISVGNSWFPVC
jgi:hypothetical protein